MYAYNVVWTHRMSWTVFTCSPCSDLYAVFARKYATSCILPITTSLLLYLVLSIPPRIVYSTSYCPLYLVLSTLPRIFYSTSYCLFHLVLSTLPHIVYTTSYCLLYLVLSTLPRIVYSTSYCLLYLVLSIPPRIVYSTSYCLFYLVLSIPPRIVYSTSYCLLYLVLSTMSSWSRLLCTLMYFLLVGKTESVGEINARGSESCTILLLLGYWQSTAVRVWVCVWHI